MIFEGRRHATSHTGKRRHHPTKLVSGLTQPWRILFSQGVLNGSQMIRQASLERLTNLLQDDGVAPTGSE